MRNEKNRRNSFGALVLFISGLILIFISIVYFSPEVADMFGGYCSPLELWQFRKSANEIINVVIDAEKEFDQTLSYPTYTDVKLDQYIYRVSTMDKTMCVIPAANNLECSLMYGQKYLQRKSSTDGGGDPITQENYTKYKDCLREYYFAMEELNACFPFCKQP